MLTRYGVFGAEIVQCRHRRGEYPEVGGHDEVGVVEYDVVHRAVRQVARDIGPGAGSPPEASVALLIGNGTFLRRDDFTARFIEHGPSDGNPMAAIDSDAAIIALASGGLPYSVRENRILQLSASLAAGAPINLRDTVTGIDNRNIGLLLTAIRHASGKRPNNSWYR